MENKQDDDKIMSRKSSSNYDLEELPREAEEMRNAANTDEELNKS